MDLVELIGNTDKFLILQIEANLTLTYFILFVIIFAESGIILCPFLPGDGLLFSVGVVAAITTLDIYVVVPLLVLAAILGYLFNYRMGKFFGIWAMNKDKSFFYKPLKKTGEFMHKHGGRAVIVSRFFPIVRTYVPFVAGAVRMDYRIFLRHTLSGGILWVCLFTLTGFFTGEIPWVRDNYGSIFLGLVFATLIPLVIQLARKSYGSLIK